MRGPALSCSLLLLAPLLTPAVRLRSLGNINGLRECVRNKGVFQSAGGRCAAAKLFVAYLSMRAANCKNCAKYFHCIGNYRAVHECNSDGALRAAEAISDCREEVDSGREDSRLDQEANRFGREGGNCSTEYMDRVECFYNPRNKTCMRPNKAATLVNTC